MKPPVIIAIIAVIALLGLGAVIMMGKKPATSPAFTSTQSVSPTAAVMMAKDSPAPKLATDSKSTFTGKLTDLFTRSESQACTLKADSAGKSMSGTYYISNSRVRGDIAVDSNISMNVIIKDQTMYYWTEKPVAMAFKMAMSDLKVPATTTSATPNQTTEMLTKDQIFDCAPWALDESKFELPTGITFTFMAK